MTQANPSVVALTRREPMVRLILETFTTEVRAFGCHFNSFKSAFVHARRSIFLVFIAVLPPSRPLFWFAFLGQRNRLAVYRARTLNRSARTSQRPQIASRNMIFLASRSDDSTAFSHVGIRS